MLFVFSTKNAKNPRNPKELKYADVFKVDPVTKKLIITYDGQKIRTKYDTYLEEDDEIHFFHRLHSREPYKYLGCVDEKRLIHPRDAERPIRLEFTIDQHQQEQDPDNPYSDLVNKKMFPAAIPTSPFRFKEGVYNAFGIRLPLRMRQEGIEIV